jgi:predicted RNase H-like HicB family nuclease
MLTAYIDAALRYVEIEENLDRDEFPDQGFIGTIPPCPGVIGFGPDEAACVADTRESLEGWILLGVRLGHELPTIDGIDINPVPVAA